MLIDGRAPAKWEKLFLQFDFMAQLITESQVENPALDRSILLALASEDVATRRVAAKLANRESLKAALPQLIAVLDDRDRIVVTRMLDSLASHHTAATLPHQIRMLEHADAIVRAAAADSIRYTLDLMEDLYPETLDSMLSAVPEVIAALDARLSDRETTVRAAAALALAMTGVDGVGDGLAKLLDNRDPETRRAAAHALVKCGARPELLIRVIRDRDTRGTALAAFSEGDSPRPSVELIPALVEALADRDKYVVSNALHCLGGLGERAEAAVEPIATLLSSKHAWSSALDALAGIGTPAARVMPALGKALLDPEKCFHAARVLDAIGAPALWIAIAGLRVRDNTVRRASLHVVARQLGEPAALDAVCELLADSNARVRYDTVLGLFDATVAARPAKAMLVRLAAEDPDHEVRNAARFTHEQLK
jgi:HEAT repeat protein